MSTDDSPEREFDVYDREDFPRATLEDAEGTSNVSEIEDMSNPSNPTGKPKSCRTPRREVWWLDLGVKNQSLESIKRRFEDRLDRFLSSSSTNSLLRQISSPMDNKLRHNLHQCPGYLREEITLASDVSKSVIISHAFPSQSEVCSICGQLVQYESTEPVVDGEKQETKSINDSHHLPQLQPSGFLSSHSSGPLSSISSDMSDGSNASNNVIRTDGLTTDAASTTSDDDSLLSGADAAIIADSDTFRKKLRNPDYERKKRNMSQDSQIPLTPMATSSASDYRVNGSPTVYNAIHSRSPSPPASTYFPLLSADTDARFRPTADAESHFAYSTTLRRHQSEGAAALKSPVVFDAAVNAEASSLWRRAINKITGQM
jgi:hypothetical protein